MNDTVKKQTILIVDDTPLNIQILIETLGDEYDVNFANSGREALEMVADNLPDLILMDIQMPEMDGYEACRRILELAPGLPIIAQTAHAFAEEKEKCLAAGMLDHITKPINPQELQAVILRCMTRVRD